MSAPATSLPIVSSAAGAEDRRGLTVEVARSFSAPAPGPDAWNDLVARSDGSVYQTHEWQSAWWEAFGAGRPAHIVVFRDGGAVVGIAPFFPVSGRSAGGRLRLIGSGEAFGRSRGIFLDDGPSDYLDVIVDPAYGNEVGRAFAEHVAGQDQAVRSIEMVNLPGDGPAMKYLVAPLAACGRYSVSVTDGDVCSRIAVSRPLPEFIRSLDAAARRRYNQASRILDGGDGQVAVRAAGQGNWDAMYADLVRLHQARWNRAGFPGLFHSAKGAGFQEAAARALNAKGWIWFTALYDGDRCIASRLGFAFRGRMYDYLSGFDDSPASAKKRPGMALLLRMYHDAFTGGMSALDLLRGDEKYKAELTSDRRTLHNVLAGPAGGPALTARISSAAGLAGFLAGREARLFGVHVRQHGLARGAASYVRFRAGRFAGKFISGKNRPTND